MSIVILKRKNEINIEQIDSPLKEYYLEENSKIIPKEISNIIR